MFVIEEEPFELVRSPLEGSTLTIVLSQAVTRMCLKYQLRPAPFMMNSLMTELHNRSLVDAMHHQECPYCGGRFR